MNCEYSDSRVDRYVHLNEQIKTFEEKKESLKREFITQMELDDTTMLLGTDKAVVKTQFYPTKPLSLQLLVEHGVDVSSEKYAKIKDAMKSKRPSTRIDVMDKSRAC